VRGNGNEVMRFNAFVLVNRKKEMQRDGKEKVPKRKNKARGNYS
jgi:hypothetical protein